jgi:FG-GAP-like repeat
LGRDIFILNLGNQLPAPGQERIVEDFEIGSDILQITDVPNVSKFSDLTFNQVGNDTYISAAGRTIAELYNIQANQLTVRDFNFGKKPNNDFNGDGKSDYFTVLRDPMILSGIGFYKVNGNNIVDTNGNVAIPTSDWKVAGTGDFNNDRRSDILWRNTDGTVAIWQMNGNTINAATIIGKPTTDWKIAGTGDFDGDGKSDILWRNTDGTVAIWQMDGLNITVGKVIGQPTTDWNIAGIGDFDGDNKSDILWQNIDGAVAIWQMDGFNIAAGKIIGQSPIRTTFGVDYFAKIVGVDDFNGDNRADIAWLNNGVIRTSWEMNGFNILSIKNLDFLPNDVGIFGTGDFNGDHRAELLVVGTYPFAYPLPDTYYGLPPVYVG